MKRTLAIVAALVLVAGAIGSSLMHPQRESHDRAVRMFEASDVRPLSIAVLPFANVSRDASAQLLVDGLHRDLRDRLGMISELLVTSHNSVMAYRGVEGVPPSIVSDLGVANVLTGDLLRDGDRLQLVATLLDTRTMETLWADTFETEVAAAPLFGLQSEVTRAVAAALGVSPTESELQRIDNVPTTRFAAYETYWLGRRYLRSRDANGLSAAVDYMLEAISIDPEYAPAYFGLATAYLMMSRFARVAPEENPEVRAQLAVERGMAIDDRYAAGWLATALLEEASGELADHACRRALELAPNDPDLVYECGRVLMLEPAARSELFEKAWRMDPLSPAANWYFALALEQAGRFEDAITLLERTVRFAPSFPNAYWSIGHIYFFALGSAEPAYRWYRDAQRIGTAAPEPPAAVARMFAELGLLAAAQPSVDRALRLGSESWWPNHAAEQLALARGDIDEAVHFAEQALLIRPTEWQSLNVLRNLDLERGRPQLALQRYRRVLPELFVGEDPQVGDDNFIAAVDVSLLLSETGDEESAVRLLERSLGQMEGMPRGGLQGFGFADVKAYALLGRADDALAALDEAIDVRYWAGWRQFETDPAFESLQHNRGFRSRVGEIREIVAEERERVDAAMEEEPPEDAR